MKQIELTTKLLLAIIALASMSAILVPSYAIPLIRSSEIVNETIRSEDIKNGEVKNADLGTDAVTSSKIKDGEVTSADIKDATITSIDIAPGTIPSGGSTSADNSVTSAKIVNGEVKTEDIASGAVKIETVERNGERSAPSPGNPLTTSLASCEGNEQLTGGGFSATDSVKIQISAEHDTIPETWIVAGRFDPTGTDSPDFTAHAYCAKIVP